MIFHPDLDKYITLETIDSTNMEMQRRRKEFLGSNVLLISEEQTAGKGQHGRFWHSKRGSGLWSSLFIGQSKVLAHNLQLLSLYTGIVIRRSIFQLAGIEASLKWPNDIMINSRKCGGILTEVQWMGSSASSAIIGFGINLNHQEQDFPADLRKSATSLLQGGWDDPDSSALLDNIVTQFFENLDLLDHPQHLIAEWNSLAWKLGKKIHWRGKEGSFDGIFQGVTINGEAIIQIGERIENFPSGEIHWGGIF